MLLDLIRKLQQMGVSVREIKRVVGGGDPRHWLSGGGIPSGKVASRFFGNGGMERVLKLMSFQQHLYDLILGYLAKGPKMLKRIINVAGVSPIRAELALRALERMGYVERTGPWGWRLTEKGRQEAKMRGVA
ncbi:MAG: hypothetical protein QXR87_05250 [Candidatus Hadarchaeales archaeon]